MSAPTWSTQAPAEEAAATATEEEAAAGAGAARSGDAHRTSLLHDSLRVCRPPGLRRALSAVHHFGSASSGSSRMSTNAVFPESLHDGPSAPRWTPASTAGFDRSLHSESGWFPENRVKSSGCPPPPVITGCGSYRALVPRLSNESNYYLLLIGMSNWLRVLPSPRASAVERE